MWIILILVWACLTLPQPPNLFGSAKPQDRSDRVKAIAIEAAQKSIAKYGKTIRNKHPGVKDSVFVCIIDQKKVENSEYKLLCEALGDRLVPLVLPRWEGFGVGMYAIWELVRRLPTDALVVKVDALDQYPTGRAFDSLYDTFKTFKSDIVVSTERGRREHDSNFCKIGRPPASREPESPNGGLYGGPRAKLSDFLGHILFGSEPPLFCKKWYDGRFDDQNALAYQIHRIRKQSSPELTVALDTQSLIAHTCAAYNPADFEITKDAQVLVHGRLINPYFFHGCGASGHRVCRKLATDVRKAKTRLRTRITRSD